MSAAGAMMVSAYKPSAAGGASDPYWSNVELLLLGGEANGSTTIKDKSDNNYSFSNGTGVSYSNTQTKFASTSLYFNGSGTGATLANNSNLHAGVDFTIEGWVYPQSTGFYGLYAFGVYGRILVGNNGGFYWETSNGSSLGAQSGYPPPGTLTQNVWQHWALTRSGNDYRFFINGTQAGSTVTNAMTLETTRNLEIGSFNGANSNKFTGYMEGLRWTKGVARYTANFTAPTALFPTS